jgi:hypothetical protein
MQYCSSVQKLTRTSDNMSRGQARSAGLRLKRGKAIPQGEGGRTGGEGKEGQKTKRGSER